MRRGPDFAALWRVTHGGVHRFHGGVVLVRVGIHRLNLACGARHGGFDITVLVANACLWRIQRNFQHFRELGTRRVGMLAVIPFNGQRIQRCLGPPPRVSHYRHGAVAHTNHFFDAGALFNRRRVKAFDLAPKHRAIFDRGVEHARQFQISTVNLFARDLVHGVEPRQSLADQFPVLRVFELDLGGRCQLARR